MDSVVGIMGLHLARWLWEQPTLAQEAQRVGLHLVEAVQIEPDCLKALPGWGRIIQRAQEGLRHPLRGELIRVEHPDQSKLLK